MMRGFYASISKIVCCVVLAIVGQSVDAAKLPELETSQQAMVSAGIGAVDDRYHAQGEGDFFSLASPGQGLSALVKADLVEVRTTTGQVGMRPLAWGCEKSRSEAVRPQLSAESNRVERVWGGGTTEWYVAGPLGVEQGFTVSRPAEGCETAAELLIDLEVLGTPVMSSDAKGLEFPEAGIQYRGLVAMDASGGELPVGLELAGNRLTLRSDVSNAEWPVIVDPMFEVTKLQASDGGQFDWFGYSVAVSGETIVVGAFLDFHSALNSGSAYVFTKPAGGWTGTLSEAAKLVASDGAFDDEFGNSVSVSGDTIVVGAHEGDVGIVEDTGSAYVFTRPQGGWSGTLTEDAKLIASDGWLRDYFGESVSISGDTIVVGSYFDDDNGDFSGSAYVFVEPVGGWTGTLNEDAKLLASDGNVVDWFGFAVAIDDSTIVIGASLDGFPTHRGAAYVFLEPGGGWTGTLNEDAKLVQSDPTNDNEFGSSVAISGDTVVVGCRSDFDSGANSGSAYVFSKPKGGWAGILTEDAKLLASDGAENDQFGRSVAIAGSSVVVGSNIFHTNADQGTAYLFVMPNDGWAGTLNETDKFQISSPPEGDQLGYSVAASGETVVVGAPTTRGVFWREGAAFVYLVPQFIFTDGFESGNTSAWANTVE